jgi:hypothetical protein
MNYIFSSSSFLSPSWLWLWPLSREEKLSRRLPELSEVEEVMVVVVDTDTDLEPEVVPLDPSTSADTSEASKDVSFQMKVLYFLKFASD